MKLGYARGGNIHQQLNRLEEYEVEELFSDGQQGYEMMYQENSEYQTLLAYAEPGDQLVVVSLEVLSRDYEQLLLLLTEFENQELELVVLNLPTLTMTEFRQLFQWSSKNERVLYPRLIQLGKEKNRNHNHYSIFSKDPEGKRAYRQIISELLDKHKMRQIAQKNGVPIETVFRINQELERVKLAIILVICFLLAIIGIKITESFSDNVFIQIGVCVVATLVILYNTLVDTGEW